jgi:acetyltransferase-like isoleucine patch superfamily enzyme
LWFQDGHTGNGIKSASQHTPATFIGEILARVRLWPSLLWRWEAQLKGVKFEGRSVFLGRPLVSVTKGARIVLGDGVRIASSVRANPLACFQPSALRAMAPGAQLILGRNVGISATALCAGASIEVGEGTIMGAGAMVFDHDFHRPVGDWDWAPEYQANARPIKIGRGVFVGARAIILKGVTIGDRAVIGAAAVVTRDVPARHLAVGNPARVIPPK